MWAPFAALITVAVARRRQLTEPTGPSNHQAYARAGALYSALLFFPWLYLLARLLGRPVPTPIVGASYAVLYAVCLAATGLTAVFAAAFATQGEQIAPDLGWAVPYGITAILLFVLAAASVYFQVRVLRVLLRKYKADRNLPHRLPLPDYAYLKMAAWLIAICGGTLVGLVSLLTIATVIAFDLSDTV